MEIRVQLKHLRIAPRKVALVADLIRGQKVTEAENQLNFIVKRASEPLQKLLKSAVAAAEHNFHLDKANLYISKITVGGGPTLKRSRPRAMGRVFQIKKRSSHVTLVLDETEKSTQASRIVKETKKIKATEEEKEAKKVERKVGSPKPKREPRLRIFKGRARAKAQKMFRRKAF